MIAKLFKRKPRKPQKRYFLVTIYVYNNNTMKKVFSDIAETDGEFPSRAHLRYQSVLSQRLNGFVCTHCEVGSIQEISGKDMREFEHVPQYIRDIQETAETQRLLMQSRKKQ